MSFPLAGNSKAVSAIICALNENRLPHALLIEGDKGTGRHTLAFFIAKAVVCEKTGLPCGECKNCKMKPYAHPDITVVAPEENKKNISVSQIRTLKNETLVKPHMADRRVFIIDFADTLNEQSQNALLKILEEPPEACMFILIAENKASLLDTVISRCITLTLSVPELETAAEYIEKNHSFKKDEIYRALNETHCNIGEALALLGGSAENKELGFAKEFLKAFLSKDSFGMLKITAQYENSRVTAQKFVKELKAVTVSALKEAPESVRAKDLCRFYTELSQLSQSLDSNINLSLFFSTLVCRALTV